MPEMYTDAASAVAVLWRYGTVQEERKDFYAIELELQTNKGPMKVRVSFKDNGGLVSQAAVEVQRLDDKTIRSVAHYYGRFDLVLAHMGKMGVRQRSDPPPVPN